MRASSALLAVVLGFALALVGCGNSRTRVPSADQPAPAGAVRAISYPAAGITIRVPRSWTVAAGASPLLATVSSGAATVAIWSHPSDHHPLLEGAALLDAGRRLVSAARRFDPALQLIRVSVARLDGRPAVELDAIEHIGGDLRRVRSVHVFTPGQEVVLDAFAPPGSFHAVDHAVFSPLKRTLRLSRLSA